MTERVPQCAPGELWYPGLQLDTEYPVPSEAELVDLWQQYNPEGSAEPVEGVYGVLTPRSDIRAMASVDLCEVIRETVEGLDAATGVNLGRRPKYDAGTWFDETISGSEYSKSVQISVIRAIMNSGLVKPVGYIAGIRAILHNWRAQGVYCVANTSTLPGCEPGTIRHTLGDELPGAFDALVLPRNHDGTGPVTKAAALGMVADQLQVDLASTPFVHIDDASHHIAGFRHHYTDASMLRLFAPLYGDEAVTDEAQCGTPFEAFLRADAYFREEGIVK